MRTELNTEAFEQQVDDDLVHGWCAWCDTAPRWALCGVDLRGLEQAKTGPTCQRCNKLWSSHERLVH